MVAVGAVYPVALGVALELLDHILDVQRPLVTVSAAVHQLLERILDLLFDLRADAGVAGHLQQIISHLVVRELTIERGQIAAGEELRNVREGTRYDRQLLAQEIIALFIGGAVARGLDIGDAEKRLEHCLHLAVHAHVLARLHLGIKHGLADAGIAGGEAQFRIVTIVLRQRDRIGADLVLVLVDGHRTLAVGEVLRGEIGEEHIREHLVDVFLFTRLGHRHVGVVDDVHIIVRTAVDMQVVRGIPMLDEHIAAQCSLKLHQGSVAVGLDAVGVGGGDEAAGKDHVQVDLALDILLLEDRLGQIAHVQERPGARAAGRRTGDDHPHLARLHFQPQLLELVRACADVAQQRFDLVTQLVPDDRILVEEVQTRQRTDLACALAWVHAQQADALGREREPLGDLPVTPQFVVGLGVLVEVQPLDDLLFGREGHLLGQYIGLDRLAVLGDLTGIQIEVDELCHREVSDVLDLRVAAPDRIENAAAQTDVDLHAGAAEGDEQRRTDLLGYLRRLAGQGGAFGGIVHAADPWINAWRRRWRARRSTTRRPGRSSAPDTTAPGTARR